MAIVEDITAEGDRLEDKSISKDQLTIDIERLTKQLTVPAELVPGFMANQDDAGLSRYLNKSLDILYEVEKKVEHPYWEEIEPEVQLRLMENVLRLNGIRDPWSSVEIHSIIQGIIPHLSNSIPLLILPTLKPYFASHPSLSSSSRALSRPVGGTDSSIDLHDVQPFKDPSSWGIINLLSYSVQHLSPVDFEKNIGLILPPTLVLMDDWEPSYRLRGAEILDIWVDKIDEGLMKRMGIDKLLIDSLIHTISLSSNPPLKGLLHITLKVIQKCTEPQSQKRTEYYSEIIEKGMIQGWTYAPSGLEGREVLMNINEMLEGMMEVMGTGIIRWLKNIIPNLLQPLQFPPTALVLPHYQSNLRCLLRVMRTLRKTGRIGRWRGQILNILCRLWVQLKEKRGLEDEDDEINDNKDDIEIDVRTLIKQIFKELSEQVPSVRDDEYRTLLDLSPGMFGDLISSINTTEISS
ncbi:hypothetical protein V866_003716 [Kwoniella sp. B9012]|uniref:Uncharacterized protein n=1 Tax=Kwoniella europaea PYCC6329 TaxID=1423913 RepID=A0AAX4KGH3_9TREE